MNQQFINTNGELTKYPDFYYVNTTEFNAKCYMEQHPELLNDPIFQFNPALHYLLYGEAAGWDPGGPCKTSPPPVCDCGNTGGDSTTQGPGNTIMQWITNNPLAVAIASGLILYALTRKKK